MSAIVSIIAMYSFIAMGYIAKKFFKEDISEKTLITLSIYFLQPMLTFWGLTRIRIDTTLMLTPFIYFLIVGTTLIILLILSKYLFDDEHDKSIFITTSLIGNTGNLGIPLGIAIFGEQSIPYTNILNIANLFFIYTVGIFFLAKANYTFKDAFSKMLKIPIMWVALFALLFNYFEFTINPQIDQSLEMGAYSAIVIQLIIFGVYLNGVKLTSANHKLTYWTTFIKLIILPVIGVLLALLFNLDSFAAKILILSLAVPLAVTAVNISALYNCKPFEVTYIIFFSTAVFLFIFYFELELMNIIFIDN